MKDRFEPSGDSNELSRVGVGGSVEKGMCPIFSAITKAYGKLIV
jgi:hypothetical protein